MRSIVYLSLSALAAIAAAQGGKDNQFKVPGGGWGFLAGKPAKLSWRATTDGTVTLKLQKNGNVTPDSGVVIASNIDNSGSFTFTPPSNLGPGSDYTIEIVDDNDPKNINFTPRFSVDGTTGTDTALPSTVPSATNSKSKSKSATETTSVATTTATTPSTTLSESSMTSSSAESSTSALTSSAPSSSTMKSSTMMTSMMASSSASTTSSEPSSTSSESGAETTVPSDGGAGSLAVPGGLVSAMLALMALV